MLDDKLKEFDALFTKYSKILPKFNKLTQESQSLLIDKERLQSEVTDLKEKSDHSKVE